LIEPPEIEVPSAHQVNELVEVREATVVQKPPW